MEKKILILVAFAMSMTFVSCSDDDDEEKIQVSDNYYIKGIWKEYAYLNSDGYYTNISASGYANYYQFDEGEIFTSWEEYTSGEHFDSASGTWEYSDIQNVVIVHQDNGRTWNITLTWKNEDDVQMDIAKTGGSASSIKAERISY